MSALKALTYAINEPLKEILYIPTGEVVKYRVKVWIDVLGARLAKAMGSFLASSGPLHPAMMSEYAFLPTLLVSGGMMWVSVMASGALHRISKLG